MIDEQRGTAVGAAVALAALLLTAPRPSAAAATLAGAATSVDPTGPVVATVALLAWAVAGWLSITVGAVLLSRLPGMLGRTARVLAARIAPATVRRGVEAALGLTVAVGGLTPAAALAAPAPPTAAPVTVRTAVAEAAWDLDWPSRTTGPPLPVSPPSPSARPSSAVPAPARPAVAVRAPERPALPERPDTAPDALVVRPGDTLWSLAEASLRSAGTASPTDRQVAQAWPRWWAANREAVGDDPDLLLPGTVLRPPPGGTGPA